MTEECTLKNATVLVTGGAHRMGRAIALELAQSGANVVLHYNTSQEAAEKVASEIRNRGVQAWTVQADLSQPNAGTQLLDQTVSLSGSIDHLVNNASIFPEQTLAELTEDTLLENLRINSLAPFAMVKAMHTRGIQGSVVNLLDTRILDFDALHAPYHLSKRMLFSLTKIMALEYAPQLRVNAVAPGLILPPSGKDENYLAQMANELPLQRHGKPEDVARAAVFLLTNTFIIGQVIYVDGGRHLRAQLYG